jgi:hypothetical protein
MKEAIHKKQVPHCVRETCNGLVKPDIVFFGEPLPRDFFQNSNLPIHADLCIIMGTSLTVHPFASLPSLCAPGTPRILINLEQVGGLGSRPDDVLLLGDCDTGVRKLADACGWLDELEALWAKTGPEQGKPVNKEKKRRDEEFQAEVDKITREVEETLRLNEERAANYRAEDVPERFVASETLLSRTADGTAKDVTGETAAEQPASSSSSKLEQDAPTTRATDEQVASEANKLADQPLTIPAPKTDEAPHAKPEASDEGGGLRNVFVNLQEKPPL